MYQLAMPEKRKPPDHQDHDGKPWVEATKGIESILNVVGLAPCAVGVEVCSQPLQQPATLDPALYSTGPGNPLGSLDLSGQWHICHMDASPNEDPPQS